MRDKILKLTFDTLQKIQKTTIKPTTEVQTFDKSERIIVVGTEYYTGAARIKEGMQKPLTLVREPKNKFDKNAVAVFDGTHHVGYISQFQAKRYKRIVEDAGGTLTVMAYRDQYIYVLLPRIPLK